ncbi:MAG TPA: hypothetical protein VFK04_08220 [Gemmatimonadaceae bacterium]|nr:hypothetical protein [Gemmatimonadaceae bacterium]
MNIDAMKPRLFAAVAVLVAAAGAVAYALRHHGDSGGGTGWLAGNGHPVQLELTFEPERGRAKEITPAGGTISATSSDGTRFELRIPEGALVYPERISVIPISSVHGLPLSGGSIAAVHLKPDGLRLMKPATLSIRPRAKVPVSEQVAFAYTGNGSDAYLYPLSLDPRRIEMSIFHFSGYGLGQAPPNDPGRRALQAAADKLARLQSQASEIMAAERALELADDAAASDWGARLAPLYLEYYDRVLRQLMIAAESDERMAECALQGFFSWMRQIQLLGLVSDGDEEDGDPGPERGAKDDVYSKLERRASQGTASTAVILDNAYKKRTAAAVKRCREEHDFTAVNEILGLERQVELLGGESNFAEDIEEIRKCLTFEVEFRSVIEQKTPTGGMYYHTVAKVPVSIDILSNEHPTAPLEYEAFRASGNPAKNLTGGAAPDRSTFGGLVLDEGANGALSPAGTRPGTFTLVGIGMSTSKKPFRQTNCEGEDEDQERETVDSLSVTFSPGTPVEMVRFTPVHAGETSSLMNAAAGFAEVLGDKAAANEAREKGRIGGGFVMEETGWLRGWDHFHADDQIQWPGAVASSGEGMGGGLFALNLRPVSPGVWRADFKSEEPPKLGFAQTESGYMIVRHTPE